jgi:ribose 5-phosphate isomerase A
MTALLTQDEQKHAEIADPAALESRLAAIVGVVDSGLFIAMASRVVVGRPTGTELLDAPHGS